ncbi:hypothetical protein [Pigmentiphaga aceris]|uniref:hypothetical protein n=1 Tax=Pigmentiphaga aceris TaxID=1940612 RepID=UPI00165286C3|nr:hypothetical protein [Pigmentiphaga aceris]
MLGGVGLLADRDDVDVCGVDALGVDVCGIDVFGIDTSGIGGHVPVAAAFCWVFC